MDGVTPGEPLIRHVSDTALWVAVYRGQESERPDALFNDPYAAKLAGERGHKIAGSLSIRGKQSWPFVARTVLGDRVIMERVAAGADMVVNIAAGLDSRPYRLPLPPELPWVEVDLPGILAYKEDILRGDKPVCRLERVACDVSDAGARRALFDQLGRRAKNALIMTEGLLVYLTADEVSALARDLGAVPGFRHWELDLVSPALLTMLQKEFGKAIERAPMQFGPVEGPAYFEPFGWKPAEAHSLFKAAAALGRLPFWMCLFALLPEGKEPWRGRQPWGGVCLLAK